jgi:hypothetical protein
MQKAKLTIVTSTNVRKTLVAEYSHKGKRHLYKFDVSQANLPEGVEIISATLIILSPDGTEVVEKIEASV